MYVCISRGQIVRRSIGGGAMHKLIMSAGWQKVVATFLLTLVAEEALNRGQDRCRGRCLIALANA